MKWKREWVVISILAIFLLNALPGQAQTHAACMDESTHVPCTWPLVNGQHGTERCCGPVGNAADCTADLSYNAGGYNCPGGTEGCPKAACNGHDGPENFCENLWAIPGPNQCKEDPDDAPTGGGAVTGTTCDALTFTISDPDVPFEYVDTDNLQTTHGLYSYCFEGGCPQDPSFWFVNFPTASCAGVSGANPTDACCLSFGGNPSTDPAFSGFTPAGELPTGNCCADPLDGNFCDADLSCDDNTDASECEVQDVCKASSRVICQDLVTGSCTPEYPAVCDADDTLDRIAGTTESTDLDTLNECRMGCCYFEGDQTSASGGDDVNSLECVRACESDSSCIVENNFPVHDVPATAGQCDADIFSETSQCCVLLESGANTHTIELNGGTQAFFGNFPIPIPLEKDIATLFAGVEDSIVEVRSGTNVYTPGNPSSTWQHSGERFTVVTSEPATWTYVTEAGDIQEVDSADYDNTWLGCRAQVTEDLPCFISTEAACGTGVSFGFTAEELAAASCPYTSSTPPPDNPDDPSSPRVIVSPTTLDEADIVAGTTITLTLENAEWEADPTFSNNKGALEQGLTTEGEWQAEVWPVTNTQHIDRTSDTVVTLTIPPIANYDISSDERLSVVVPEEITDHNQDITKTNAITISAEEAANPDAVYVEISGSVVPPVKEAEVRTNGLTITLTLHNADWVPHPAFSGIRNEIIAGLISESSVTDEPSGWEARVKPAIGINDVVRAANDVVVISIDPVAGYNIQEQEGIRATIPAAATTHDEDVISTENFIIHTDQEEINERRVALSGSVTEQIKESAIRARDHKLVITLINEQFIETDFMDHAADIIAGITNTDEDNPQAEGWNKNVRDEIPVTTAGVFRKNDRVVEILIPQNADYAITTNEGISVTVPSEVLENYDNDLVAQDIITVFDEDEDPPDECAGNTIPCECGNDCPTGECTGNQDCPSGQVCLDLQCEVPTGCTDNSDCSAGQVCTGGQCVAGPECTDNSDCSSGQMCSGGSCVAAPECTNNNECSSGEVCIDGSCVSSGQCTDNSDCASGEICSGGQCIADQGCTDDDDCPGSQVCTAGQCEAGPQCTSNSQCGTGETCIDGVCVADTTPPTATIEIN